ncbi:ROK family protein [Faecalibaculum rodentium]|uniref:ROK family protein n=1 Tax=Faecalibaculum rodentium TaxID=1702221 RepID=UPI0023EFA416|nr:ROK family protein [Faecalibaculum rodentium]
MESILCFDLGGTRVKYGLFQDRVLTESGSFPTDRSQGLRVLQSMKDLVSRYEPDALSVSSPGFADNSDGIIHSGNVIEGFNGLNLRSWAREECNLPLALENDANCAALAEYAMGAGQGSKALAVITLGTGVGGGLVLDGKLWAGNHRMAGEFGFLFIHGIHTDRPEDEILSGHASTRALCEVCQEPDGKKIFEKAAAGDARMQQALGHFLDSLAMAVYNIAYTVAPDTVLIGGAVSAQESLIPEVKKRVSALTPSFSVDLTDIMTIDSCRFGNEAGLYGALANWMLHRPESPSTRLSPEI